VKLTKIAISGFQCAVCDEAYGPHFAAEKILFLHLIDWTFVNFIYGLCIRYFGIDKIVTLSDEKPAQDIAQTRYPDEKLQDKILGYIIASTWNPVMPTGRLAVLLWKFRRYRDAGWKRRLVYKSSGPEAFVRSVVAHLKKPASLWR